MSPQPPDKPPPEGPEEFARRVLELRDRLAPKHPDIDPGDLLLICQSLPRPPGTGRRFFVRPDPGGGWAP